ncbi:M55 family metallopeptidase [Streptomyces sp. AV19]|uniref:M55 family metallopeptidase n=1 Tax=Streptomyces sp. AV19 TaxID=2793068 RepID=UPI0018FEC006|nr:M55 family metallopeptidase [Streptomyces sp. AV19]MBH1938271.1 M55 family metallopeptidase [Streptomyces sp. AV19]MDG4534901.1 M55 family metallopeptidase [Streptomyces sp. AV19]
MKILISAGMEGATGFASGRPERERCRWMFTSDVDAAARGFFDGGAHQDRDPVRGVPRGAEGAPAHTCLCGARASEGMPSSPVAAEYGVPVVLVTGVGRTCEGAKGYAPRARSGTVEENVSRYVAVCRASGRTAEVVREAARGVVGHAARREPVQAGPFDVRRPAGGVSVAQAGERQVSSTTSNMFEAIRCPQAVTTVVAAAVEEAYG